uniref:WGS project CAEQ00000000 data, annotated contig 812 n=1 Tax=Trypanosoma congolense (strain IL3000) TaxID=1068625 RepID=F9WIL3_TRYCI|nr:unnamed protein product [Trypanosoma congolense IL3000]
MHWCIGLLLVLALFVVATAFHGSAWRVVRCHDVMTGTLSTFIAVFFVDLTFTIVSFPVIFILSVLLEPLLFTILAAFSITTSLPVLLEHLPTVPADGVSCLLCPLDVGGQRHCRSLDEFCVQVVPFFSRQLLSNPPPVRWSERWSHPKPITCAHEVQQLSVECQHDNSHRPLSLTGGRKDISYTVQQLLSRCIGLVFVLRQVACWKVSRCRETSSAVVRLAHLREGYGALFPPRTAFSPEEVVDQPLADLKVSKLLSRASPVKRSSPGNAFG